MGWDWPYPTFQIITSFRKDNDLQITRTQAFGLQAGFEPASCPS